MQQFSGGIQHIADVHPQVLFCRNSAVIKVTKGKDLFTENYNADKWSWLSLENKHLYISNVDHTGSYRDSIHLGYGNGNIAADIISESLPKVNGAYTKLVNAIDAIHSLLNLLKNGLYLIADLDLFPVQKENGNLLCFWNLWNHNGEYKGCYWPYANASEWAGGWGYNINEFPLYMVPTQPANSMNPERIKTYMKQLKEFPENAPRSIGLYLRGSAVLLLDGHHKAMAAAAMGVPAKTLVIFKLDNDKELLESAEHGKRLFLRNNPFRVCDHEETFSNCCGWFGEMRRPNTIEQAPLENTFDLKYGRDFDEQAWGHIDEQWIAEMKNPHLMNESILRDGTSLPCHTIKACLADLQKMPPEELKKRENKETLHKIRCYVLLTPGNKWITSSQRRWMDELYERYYI